MGTPDNVVAELKSVLAEFKNDIRANNEQINKKLDHIQECLNPVKEEVKILNKKVEIIDRNTRRKNLIIHGLPETEKETPAIQEDLIINLISQKLQVTDFSKLELDFVRRMGLSKRDETKPRPIIMGLTTERRKQEILRSCKLLKNTNISVQQDLTVEARTMRKELVNKMKEEKKKGNDLVIRKNKLVMREKVEESNQGIGNNKRALSQSPEIQSEINTHKKPQLQLSNFGESSTSAQPEVK